MNIRNVFVGKISQFEVIVLQQVGCKSVAQKLVLKSIFQLNRYKEYGRKTTLAFFYRFVVTVGFMNKRVPILYQFRIFRDDLYTAPETELPFISSDKPNAAV